MDEYRAYEGDSPPARPWQNPLTWSALAALGFLVYELTAQPGLGAAVLCLKFGLNDVRTAWWLWRIDGNRPRARVCFWLYLASALWKVAITGTILTFAVPILDGLFNPRPVGQGPANAVRLPDTFVVAILTSLFGFFFSVLTTVIAFWGAWRHGVWLWLNSRIHGARRSDTWPSLFPWYGTTNQTGRLVLTALVSAFGVAAIVGIAVLLELGLGRKNNAMVITMFVITLMVAGPVTVLALRDFAMRRMLAKSPVQCWGKEDRKRADWLGIDDLAAHDNRNPDL
jgi:hypothetical protein